MNEQKTVTIDGVEYCFDSDLNKCAIDCRGCVAYMNEKDELCQKLPGCWGGVWKVKEAIR